MIKHECDFCGEIKNTITFQSLNWKNEIMEWHTCSECSADADWQAYCQHEFPYGVLLAELESIVKNLEN